MALVVDGGGLVNKGGALGTGAACCCGGGGGVCDCQNPCPEGFQCVDGECVAGVTDCCFCYYTTGFQGFAEERDVQKAAVEACGGYWEDDDGSNFFPVIFGLSLLTKRVQCENCDCSELAAACGLAFDNYSGPLPGYLCDEGCQPQCFQNLGQPVTPCVPFGETECDDAP